MQKGMEYFPFDIVTLPTPYSERMCQAYIWGLTLLGDLRLAWGLVLIYCSLYSFRFLSTLYAYSLPTIYFPILPFFFMEGRSLLLEITSNTASATAS